MDQYEYIANNYIDHIQEILVRYDAKTIFLVTGKKSYELSGAKKRLSQQFDKLNVFRFSDFEVNPKLDDVVNGISLIKEIKPDVIVAVGGGSAIDMAKLISVLSRQDITKIPSYIYGDAEIRSSPLPLIAIPTTVGTGSESTQFAVVYVNNVKYSLSHPYLLPKYAVIDPTLSYNLPSSIVASSGMDALSQAIESFWAKKATDSSRMFAVDAIELILPVIKKAVDGDQQSIEIMARAAHIAGKAINISTTTAAHAISYPITTYFNVPHGHAVALMLGDIFVYNAKCPDMVSIIEALCDLFNVKSAEEFCVEWYKLMGDIGLKFDFNAMGIKSVNDLDVLLDNINEQRLSNNPVSMKLEDINELLMKRV